MLDLADIFNAAIKDPTETVEGESTYILVFTEAIKLTIAEAIVFYKPVLSQPALLHHSPQTVVRDHLILSPYQFTLRH